MRIYRNKQPEYVRNLSYPVIGDNVQNDLNDTDSIIFSRVVARRAVVLCADRIEQILANNPDDFDLEEELSKVHETLRFAETNLMPTNGVEVCKGNTAWMCVDYIGREFVFTSKPHMVNFSWRNSNGRFNCIELPVGSIEKLIGRELTWEDEPVELKEE